MGTSGCASAGAAAAASARSPLARQLRRKLPLLILILAALVSLLLALLLWRRIFISVPPGQAGVLFQLFGGTQVTRVYGEGLQVVAPWNQIFLYETRRQVIMHEFDVLSAPGLPLHLELAIRFAPERDRLALLHQRIGPDYPLRVVVPQTESVLRRELSHSTAEQIYTNAGGLLGAAITRAREEAGRNFVSIDEILIRSIALPEPIKAAIEDKVAQEQLMQSYAFRLETAHEEAKRKRAEARGVRDYQATVDSTLNERMLHHEGIAATRELATSPNAKVIVLGNQQQGGLPLVPGGQ